MKSSISGRARLQAVTFTRECKRRNFDLDRCYAALILSSCAHSGQIRTSDGTAYITHPVQVATLVSRHGFEEDIVIAALLHDVAEDAPAFSSTILRMFGPRVDALVLALTKNQELTHSVDRRKEAQDRLLNALPSLGAGLAAIKMADRAHNLTTSHHLSPHKMALLVHESKAFYAPLAAHFRLDALAKWFSNPAAWHAVYDFVPQIFQIQPYWAELIGHPALIRKQSFQM